MKNDGRKENLSPKLRFPEFRDGPEWEALKVEELVDTVAPPKKLPTSEYFPSGLFPIVDQSQSEISGWTDDRDAVITEGLPLVIFGDHTCILKLVDHPFAQGADGIKILKALPKISARYLYQFLNYRPVATEEYKRHFSILKDKYVFFPDVERGEQHKIAGCLSSLDELIEAERRKLETLQAHKKGLIQQLFPREGATVPRLRFPEFRNAPEWTETEVGSIFRVTRGEVLSMKLVKESKSSQSPYPVFSSQTKNSGLCGFYSDFLFEDAITWTTDGANAGDVNFRQGKFYCTNVCGVLLSSDGYANPCVAALIGSVARKYVSYVGNPKLMNGVMGSIVVPLPSLPEQQRIASCLVSIDELIVAQNDKVAALKAHKQGLMQQLFPSATEAES